MNVARALKGMTDPLDTSFYKMNSRWDIIIVTATRGAIRGFGAVTLNDSKTKTGAKIWIDVYQNKRRDPEVTPNYTRPPYKYKEYINELC